MKKLNIDKNSYEYIIVKNFFIEKNSAFSVRCILSLEIDVHLKINFFPHSYHLSLKIFHILFEKFFNKTD